MHLFRCILEIKSGAIPALRERIRARTEMAGESIVAQQREINDGRNALGNVAGDDRTPGGGSDTARLGLDEDRRQCIPLMLNIMNAGTSLKLPCHKAWRKEIAKRKIKKT